MPNGVGAVTRGDRVLAECLAQAPWDLFMLAISGRWSARCDRIHNTLGLYGLHWN